MSSGSVTLNGVDDEILAISFKFKAEHEGLFQFNLQQMQPAVITQGPHKPGKPGYNGMTFSWNNPNGLKLVIALLQKIETHHANPSAPQQA